MDFSSSFHMLIYMLEVSSVTYVSVSSNWVHPPGQPPGISSKTLPGGSGFDF